MIRLKKSMNIETYENLLHDALNSCLICEIILCFVTKEELEFAYDLWIVRKKLKWNYVAMY